MKIIYTVNAGNYEIYEEAYQKIEDGVRYWWQPIVTPLGTKLFVPSVNGNYNPSMLVDVCRNHEMANYEMLGLIAELQKEHGPVAKALIFLLKERARANATVHWSDVGEGAGLD